MAVIFGGNGNDQINGLAESDTIHGGNGDDTLAGGGGDNWIYGDNGNDRIFGSGQEFVFGHNHLFGGNGNDFLSGAIGNDTLDGGNGDDILIGGDYAYERGTAGGDLLLGGNGNDLLDGGGGVDTLVGGRGADTFRFGVAGDIVPVAGTGIGAGNRDMVLDFEQGRDIIDLSNYQNYVHFESQSAPVFLGTGSFGQSNGLQVRYDIQGDHTIIQLIGTVHPSSPWPAPAGEIDLAGVFHLTASDFHLV